MDNLVAAGRINNEERAWLIIAMAVAMKRIATTTGHFAQRLQPKVNNIAKYIAQRKRSFADEWMKALSALQPLGTRKWRLQNKVFQEYAEPLLLRLNRSRHKPILVYADPPYTKDQYSRYYHVYETLLLYDLPAVQGKGLYRNDRFVSKYCLSSTVDEAIETLIAACAEMGADMILSYPTNGLFDDSRYRLPEMFQKHYRKKVDVIELPHMHSTMGASKGKYKNQVLEIIYRGVA